MLADAYIYYREDLDGILINTKVETMNSASTTFKHMAHKIFSRTSTLHKLHVAWENEASLTYASSIPTERASGALSSHGSEFSGRPWPTAICAFSRFPLPQH